MSSGVKYLSWIVTLPLALVAVVFAVANRDAATLNIWPLGIALEAPLFILVLGSALIGLLAGGLIAWLSAGSSRQRRNEALRRAEAAERELAFLRSKLEADQGAAPDPRDAKTGIPASDARLDGQAGSSYLPAARV